MPKTVICYLTYCASTLLVLVISSSQSAPAAAAVPKSLHGFWSMGQAAKCADDHHTPGTHYRIQSPPDLGQHRRHLREQGVTWQQDAVTESPSANTSGPSSTRLLSQPQHPNDEASLQELARDLLGDSSRTDSSGSWQQVGGPQGLLAPTEAPSLQGAPALTALETSVLNMQQATAPVEPINPPGATGPVAPGIMDRSVLDAVEARRQQQQQPSQPQLLLGPAAHVALAKGLPLAELAFPGGSGSLLADLGSLFAAQTLQHASACAFHDGTLDLGTHQEPGGFGILCADRPVGSIVLATLSKNFAPLAELHDQLAATESRIQEQLRAASKRRLQRLQMGKDLVADIIRPTLQQYATLLRPISLFHAALLQQGAALGRSQNGSAGPVSDASLNETAAGSSIGSSTLTTGSQAGAFSLQATRAGVGNLARSTATGSVNWWELALPMGLAGLLLAFALAVMLYMRQNNQAQYECPEHNQAAETVQWSHRLEAQSDKDWLATHQPALLL
ncbi:hypothetical protein WJX74_002580 [Apatococcus lobatus]|uniref:Uncharacterized protein n=1 Tax=Apatococcus lobatus TaxID=904363 RepID=A0AAW1S6Y4_9CHLO